MKAVFVNGSPHVNGNTARALEEVASARRAADALARAVVDDQFRPLG